MFENNLKYLANLAQLVFQKGAIGNICVLRPLLHLAPINSATRLLLVKLGRCILRLFVPIVKLRQN